MLQEIGIRSNLSLIVLTVVVVCLTVLYIIESRRINRELNGIKEKLVGLELDGDPLTKAPENFWPVNNSEKKVGRVSRAFFSPRLKKNIALAIVDIEFADEGSKLVVESPYGDLNCVVVKMPWYQADKDTHLD